MWGAACPRIMPQSTTLQCKYQCSFERESGKLSGLCSVLVHEMDCRAKLSVICGVGNGVGLVDGVRQWLDDGCRATIDTARHHRGITPLMAACSERDEAVLSLLLDSGARVEKADGSGKTALMYACGGKGSGEAMVRLLLDRVTVTVWLVGDGWRMVPVVLIGHVVRGKW